MRYRTRIGTIPTEGPRSTSRSVFLRVWSVAVRQVVRGGFERKIIANILSDTERMKNTPIQVCAKTVFVG
jgi:hypothetical protein